MDNLESPQEHLRLEERERNLMWAGIIGVAALIGFLSIVTHNNHVANLIGVDQISKGIETASALITLSAGLNGIRRGLEYIKVRKT